MKYLLYISIALLSAIAKAQCTYIASNPFPGNLTIAAGETLCVTGDLGTTNTSISVQSGGMIRIYNGSKFTVNGSLAVNGTGKIQIEDCNSKLWVNGTYQGVWNVCEIDVFCDTCNPANIDSRFWKLVGGVEVWRNMCCQAGLPVELISFTVESDSCTDYLKWTTASEINNDYFVVEHSTNGVEWKNVASVDGAGNNFTELNYSVKLPAGSGENYYRLKQIDFDGTYSYSTIIMSKCLVKERKLLKICNILGQEVDINSRGMLFFIYNDGTSEKILRR